MNIQISVARPNALGAADFAPSPHYNLRVVTQNDLRQSEKAIYDLGNQGTAKADDDHGVQTRPDSTDEDWFNDDGSLKREHWHKDPDLDIAEIRRQLGEERYAIAADDTRIDEAAETAREKLVEVYESFYGLKGTNIESGMSMVRQLRLFTYPPPDKLSQWVRSNENGDKVFGGDYFDQSGGEYSPDELGVNSVGRALEDIDLSQPDPQGNPVRGVAIEGYGEAIVDKWTFPAAVKAANRSTRGGPKQWHIPRVYIDRLPKGTMRGVTWRDLPGNARILPYVRWQYNPDAKRGEWVYTGSVEDGTSMDDLDNGLRR